MGWYVSIEGKVHGPVSDEQVQLWVSQGLTDAMLCAEGSKVWMPLRRSPFAPVQAPAPAPAPAPAAPAKVNVSPLGGCLSVVLTLASIVGLVSAFQDCGKHGGSAAPPPTPSAMSDSPEAQAAASTIRQVFPIAGAADDAVSAAAACADKTVGYDPALACFRSALAKVTASRDALSALRLYPGSCSRDVAAGAASVVSNSFAYLSSLAAWMESNEPTLRRRMATASLWKACSGQSCDGRPFSSTDGFAPMNVVPCTETLFRCGTPDNRCTTNKVASALGVGFDGRPTWRLTVRATGEPVN